MLARLFPAFAVFALLFSTGIAVAAPTSADPSCLRGDPTPGLDELIHGAYTLAFSDLTHVDVTGRLDVFKVTTGDGRQSADGIRRAYRDESAVGGGEFLVQDIEAEVSEAFLLALTQAFPGATVDAKPAVLDRATLEAPGGGSCFSPAVSFDLAADVTLDFGALVKEGANPQHATTALKHGARIGMDFPVNTAPGNNATYTFELPQEIVLGANPVGATRVSDGAFRTTVANWNGDATKPTSIAIVLAGRGATAPTAEDATLEVVIDLKDIETSLGDLIDKKLPTIPVGLTATAKLAALKLPDAVQTELAKNRIELAYLSAEGIRAFLDTGVVTREKIDEAQQEMLKKLREQVVEFGGSADAVTGGFADGTLAPGATGPIVLGASAEFRMSPGNGGGAPRTTAMVLHTIEHALPLKPVQGYPTDYTVYLPPGIALVDVSGEGAEKVSRGDQEGFRMRATSESSNVVATFGLTMGFVWAKFPGVVLGILGVLLLILLGIALIVRKVVRGRKARRSPPTGP